MALQITEINGLRKISPKSAKNNLLILQLDNWWESFQLVSAAVSQMWEKTEPVNREGNLYYMKTSAEGCFKWNVPHWTPFGICLYGGY